MREHADVLNDVLAAISHPKRRAIIAGLAAEGPTRFTDVAKPLNVNLNAVTKHLKLLNKAGLITRDKRGREVYIMLQPEPLKMVARYIHPYERFWNERLDTFQRNFKRINKKK
jgi:DNA-binding transcriptional ArsR family regulator